jgi:hypothetical protein
MKRGELRGWLTEQGANVYAPIASETSRLWAIAEEQGLATSWRSIYETMRQMRKNAPDGAHSHVVRQLENAIASLQDVKSLILAMAVSEKPIGKEGEV